MKQKPHCYLNITHVHQRTDRGAALVVVLAMLVLMLGLVVAFLARSNVNRQTSFSSANMTAVDLLTSLAINNTIGDLQMEIFDSNDDPTDLTAKSTFYDPPNGGNPLYLPKLPADAVPEVVVPDSGGTVRTAEDMVGSGLENVIKISTSTSGVYTPPAGSLASRAADAPTSEPARNGRSISAERWNKPLLMERTSDTDDTPRGDFRSPDWILVARDGSNPTTLADARYDPDASNTSAVIGRYAYIVYNQGGLLDANVAGHPSSAAADLSGVIEIDAPARYKPSIAYADLTISEIGMTDSHLTELVANWRNQATFSAPSPAEEFYKLNIANEFGFLAPSNTTTPGGVTDRMFTNRQQLIRFFSDKLGGRNTSLMNALEYLSTFSRSLKRPTFYRMQGRESSLPNYNALAPVVYNWTNPALDNNNWAAMDGLGNNSSGEEHIVNPIIPAVTMTTNGTRFDGTSFQPGDPMMEKRFPLNRVLWLTYKGPSADLDMSDDLVVELKKHGITEEFLKLGTEQNIEKAFGLSWTPGPGPDGIGGYWTYQESSAIDSIRSLSHPIQNDGVDTLGREPNFFEILKASINCGAIGRARAGLNNTLNGSEHTFDDQILKHSSINNQIFQIAANIIDQAHPENFPTHIVLPDGSHTTRARSFWGTVNLPYFYGYSNIGVMAYPASTPTYPSITWQENGLQGKGPGGSDKNLADPVFDPINNPVLNTFTGTSINLTIPHLWNPHGVQSLPPAALSPSAFRICVTTDTLALPSSIGSGDVGIDGGRINERTGGSKLVLPGGESHPEFYNWSPDWSTNADGSDAASLGVIRFGADDRTAITFTYTDPAKFRNPTPLMRIPNSDIGETTAFPDGVTIRLGPGHQLRNVDMNSSGLDGDFGDGIKEDVTEHLYVGFLRGRTPLLFNSDKGSGVTAADPATTVGTRPKASVVGQALTFSLEYTLDDPTSNTATWIPYKQTALALVPQQGNGTLSETADAPYRVSLTGGGIRPHLQTFPTEERLVRSEGGTVGNNRTDESLAYTRLMEDPRTNRWGSSTVLLPQYNLINSTTAGHPAVGEFWTVRSGAAVGSGYNNYNGNGIGDGGASSKTSILWDHVNSTFSPFYDADGVLRRPMGAYAGDPTNQSATSTIGLPMSAESIETTGDDRFNRPIILHRPFRNVGELSHVFTDTPWRNIDFSTPESGFSGLLDVFCIHDDMRSSPVEAGKVDLNTLQKPVIKALLAGGYRDALGDALMPDLQAGTNEAAELLADALVDRTTSRLPGQGPLWNLAHLVGRFDPNEDIQSQTPSAKPVRFNGFSNDIGINSGAGATVEAQNVVKRLREAPIRILAQNGTASTWNLLIDIIAQRGRYTPTSNDINDFLVEGEKRVWVHVAIDRLTGRVIDTEVEVVTE